LFYTHTHATDNTLTHVHTYTYTHTAFEMLAQYQMIWMLMSMSVGWTHTLSTAQPIKDEMFGYCISCCCVACEPPPTQKLYMMCMGRPPATSAPSLFSPFIPPFSSFHLSPHSSLLSLFLSHPPPTFSSE